MTVTKRIPESDEQALKDDLVEMYRLVSLALDKALQSLKEYDADTAAQVISEDKLIKRIVENILCHVVVSPIIFKPANKIESLTYVNKNIA